MKSDISVVLNQSLSHVLKSFVFMFPEEASKEELQNHSPKYICAEITIQGKDRSRFYLCAPLDLSLQISANICGVEVDDPEMISYGQDGLMELLNIVSSHVASILEGINTPLKIGIPDSSVWEKEEKWAGLLNSREVVGFIVEGSPILFGLEIVTH